MFSRASVLRRFALLIPDDILSTGRVPKEASRWISATLKTPLANQRRSRIDLPMNVTSTFRQAQPDLRHSVRPFDLYPCVKVSVMHDLHALVPKGCMPRYCVLDPAAMLGCKIESADRQIDRRCVHTVTRQSNAWRKPPARRPKRCDVQHRQPDQQGHDPRPEGFLAVVAHVGDVPRRPVRHKRTRTPVRCDFRTLAHVSYSFFLPLPPPIRCRTRSSISIVARRFSDVTPDFGGSHNKSDFRQNLFGGRFSACFWTPRPSVWDK